MGAFSNPVLTGVTATATSGLAAQGGLEGMGALNLLVIPFTITGPASYDTGGSVVTLPTVSGKGLKLAQIIIANPINPGFTRQFIWDSSKTAPKIIALAFPAGTQVAGATSLTGETLIGAFIFEG